MAHGRAVVLSEHTEPRWLESLEIARSWLLPLPNQSATKHEVTDAPASAEGGYLSLSRDFCICVTRNNGIVRC